jgi:hypothetical protein
MIFSERLQTLFGIMLSPSEAADPSNTQQAKRQIKRGPPGHCRDHQPSRCNTGNVSNSQNEAVDILPVRKAMPVSTIRAPKVFST